MDKQRQANRANWDERADIHFASTASKDADGYHVQRFIDDPEHISGAVEFDRAMLGDVGGKTLLHLMCHIGTDTLSWARLGADVTGVDFSSRSIALASQLSELCGTPGRFIVAEFYDTPSAVVEQFDVVYTGDGAVSWLPDISGWAQVVSAMLKPGGALYVRDIHPMMLSLDKDNLQVRRPYFESDPWTYEADTSYTGDGTVENRTLYQWNHGLGEMVTAIIRSGMRIEFLHEHKFSQWRGLSVLQQGDDGMWRIPDNPDLVPLMFSIRATKES